MAPRNDLEPVSDSDSDIPEAISLSQSKRQIQKIENSRKNAAIAERQSKKVQNRERDKKLKERAEKNKDLGKKGKSTYKGKEREDKEEEDEDSDEEEAVDGLEARMQRAMKEAQEEDDDDEDGDEEFESFEGVQLDEDEDDEEAESGEEDSDEDSEDGDEESKNDEESQKSSPSESEAEEDHQPPSKSLKSKVSTKFNPDHLPDELFAAAFASQPSAKRTFSDDSDLPSSKVKNAAHPAKKRKANPNTPKDVVVGSRAIRVLPSSTNPPTPSTMPSRKIKRFLDRALALKGGKQKTKGWERRPVNLGVLRRNAGPAANFVRNP